MSESGNSGESSYGRSSSSESVVSSPASSWTPPAEKTKVTKTNFTKIKTTLKNIELAVTKNLSTEEKEIFIQVFRKLIIDNEKQVIEFSNASFFIEKFSQHPINETLSSPLKNKILSGLNDYELEEKKNNSKLKYW